jgi:hypothetical protein
VDETFDSIREADGVEVDEKSEMVVGHFEVSEKLGRVDREQRFNGFEFDHETILHQQIDSIGVTDSYPRSVSSC